MKIYRQSSTRSGFTLLEIIVAVSILSIMAAGLAMRAGVMIEKGKSAKVINLVDTLKEENYQPGEYVVREGESGDRLYFIVAGNLVAEKRNPSGKEEVVFKYKDNEYFGEIALVKNTVRQASIKAVSHCQLLSIGRGEFKRLLGPIEDILKRNMDKYKKFVSS